MERLDDLVLFVEVVERAGFASAARHLDMQRSKLSRRIGELEERMGVRLLQRNTRSVSLTPAGEQIYGHARGVVEEARAAFNVAAELNGEPSGLLRMTCPVPFAVKVLTPIVAEFGQKYPRLRTLIDASDRVKDLVSEGFELAFRAQAAPLSDSSLIARPLGNIPMAVVASPALIEAHGPVQHPQQLADLRLLGPHDGRQSIHFSHPGEGDYLLTYEPHLVSGNLLVLESAAIGGLGAACLPRYLCHHALSSGELIELFDTESNWAPHAGKLYALLPTRRGNTLAVKTFLEFALPRLGEVL